MSSLYDVDFEVCPVCPAGSECICNADNKPLKKEEETPQEEE